MKARLVVFPIKGRNWCFFRSIDPSSAVGSSHSSSSAPPRLKDLWRKLISDGRSIQSNAELVVDFASDKMNHAWINLGKSPPGSVKNRIHDEALGGLLEVRVEGYYEGGYHLPCEIMNPRTEIPNSEELLSVVRLLISEDACSGRFIFGRQELAPAKLKVSLPKSTGGGGGDNPKSQLQTLLVRAGHSNPSYTTKQMKMSQFRATVEFSGMQFVGQPCNNKKLAEQDAAKEALSWLNAGGASSESRYVDQLSFMLKNKNKHRRRA